MKKTMILTFLFYCSSLNALTFLQAVTKLANHESIAALDFASKALESRAEQSGSWGDPKINIAAKNFPMETLNYDETPMTGVEFGVSQKIALTPKYSKIYKSLKLDSEAVNHNSQDRRNLLILKLWELIINNRKINDELKILEENKLWVQKILNVSKKLYSTGKTNQQGLLDIQIRKSEIENHINNKKYEKLQIGDHLKFLVGDTEISEETIPWELLEQEGNKLDADYREKKLKVLLKAKDLKLSASKLNFVPDLTFSVGYTKRSNIDERGDFLSARVSFPLPFSAEKYASYASATHEKYQAEKLLKNFQRQKRRDIAFIEKEIAKIKSELSILIGKTIKFAQNSRSITSKSYGLGDSTYVELLQSEFKLQNILMHKVKLIAKRDLKKMKLKYMKGYSLHE